MIEADADLPEAVGRRIDLPLRIRSPTFGAAIHGHSAAELIAKCDREKLARRRTRAVVAVAPAGNLFARASRARLVAADSSLLVLAWRQVRLAIAAIAPTLNLAIIGQSSSEIGTGGDRSEAVFTLSTVYAAGSKEGRRKCGNEQGEANLRREVRFIILAPDRCPLCLEGAKSFQIETEIGRSSSNRSRDRSKRRYRPFSFARSMVSVSSN